MSSNLSFELLVDNLESVIKIYRSLLVVVRKEKDILIAANLDDLNENNKIKEDILIQARKLERERQEIVSALVEEDGVKIKSPSLLDLANFYQGEKSDKLRNLHAVLELLIKRVKDINNFNEKLINSALHNITGAMKSIKDMLDENKTYQKEGAIQPPQAGQSSGQLVSRQV